MSFDFFCFFAIKVLKTSLKITTHPSNFGFQYKKFRKGDQAGFYIQAVTTLVILAVYLLTLVAPIFCPNTDFGSRLQSARRGQINNSVEQDPDITDFDNEKQAHHGPVAGEEL